MARVHPCYFTCYRLLVNCWPYSWTGDVNLFVSIQILWFLSSVVLYVIAFPVRKGYVQLTDLQQFWRSWLIKWKHLEITDDNLVNLFDMLFVCGFV